MRWKLALAALAVLLVADATTATAQVKEGSPIPVTMTMEPDEHPDSLNEVRPPASNNPVDSVEFRLPDDTSLGDRVLKPGDGVGHSQQTLVGLLPIGVDDNEGPAYRLKAHVYIAHSAHFSEFWFNQYDSCTKATNMHIERIACAVEKRGKDLVCTAIYEGMENPADFCGSHACVTCRRVQVCGADPECP
jgi:hypothetical protein